MWHHVGDVGSDFSVSFGKLGSLLAFHSSIKFVCFFSTIELKFQKSTRLKVCNEKFDHSLGEAVVPELATKKSMPPVLFSSGDRALCSTNIKGHLLYGIDHNLSVCDGRTWLEVTKPNQILRHFEDYDDIYAHSKTFDIESFEIENEGNYFGKRG